MNWLTDFVAPKLKTFFQKDIPENLWHSCPECHAMIFHKDLKASLSVCPQCDFHMVMDAKDRLESLFDEGVYQTIELPKMPFDPLDFKDKKKYKDRLKEARERTGREDAILVAHGRLNKIPTVIAVFDFKFMAGSMSAGVGEAIVAAADLARMQRAALIVIPASGGARMQEGILSLMQMPRTIIAIEKLRAEKLPYIVLLTNPTTGGVTASFAMVGDVHIAEKGALIGFAGQRVIEQTIRQKLPDGFQRSEYLKEHGMIDQVLPRKEVRPTLARLIDLLMRKQEPAEIIPLHG